MPAIVEPVNARSRRTRARLLAAARELLEDGGFEALTMGAVADAARVTRRSVYLHFGSHGELVRGLFDHVAEQEGLAESLAQVWEAPDAAEALNEWARHLARYHARLIPMDRAIERMRHADPHARQYRERVAREKLRSCMRLSRRIAEEGRLASPWTEESAADMLFALTSSDVVEGLMADRHWSRRKLAELLGELLRRTFLDADRA
jgi:AcrR family transcriptional regulator